MPASDVYDINKDASSRGDDERKKRMEEIDLRWEWYEGNHPDTLRVEAGEKNDNIKLGLIERGVDKAVDFVRVPKWYELPGGITRSTDAEGVVSEERTVEQDALDVLYERYAPDLPDLLLTGWTSGHSFMKLHWEDVEGVTIPAMSLIDPRIMTVYWQNGRSSKPKPVWYRMQWTDGRSAWRQDIVPGAMVGNEGATWVIIDYMQQAGGRWEEQARDIWGFPFSPIVDVPHKRVPYQFYGKPGITKMLMNLNNSINFVNSNTGRIIKFHAHPRTIGVGVDAADVEATSIDGFFTTPAGTNVFNLEMQSDLLSSMAFDENLRRELYSEMRVVDTASIKDKLGQLTNFGLRQLFNDQIEMTEEHRRDYGAAMGEALRRMLWMAGYEFKSPPVATWPEILPTNRIEAVAAAQAEYDLGVVSARTLAEELGRNYEAEQAQKRLEEQDASDVLTDALLRSQMSGGLTRG